MKFNNTVMHSKMSLKKNKESAIHKEERCATLKEMELAFQEESAICETQGI